MSNEAITWAYAQPITTGAKFVLVALADMADEAHSCYPGQAKLAAMTGQGVRTVRRQLLELEVGGFLSRGRRFDAAGHRTSDRYVLPVGKEIPTGQIDRRPKQPQAKLTAGQIDQRPSVQSLPAIYDSPTGQNGQVSLREPSVEPPVRPRKRATRLPDDWKPSADDIAWQRAKAIPDGLARREFEKFVNHWRAKAGSDAAKLDWSATWRNWLLRSQERAAPPADAQVQARIAARVADPLASAR